MNSSRVWELLGALGGVADERSVAALDLSAEEADELGAAVRELVDSLLERCHVSHDHWGELSEAVAAAVVASGEDRYRQVHDRGGVLDPADWRWQEADALLGLGGSGEEPAAFVLQWITEDLPDGVSSAWSAGHPTSGSVLPDGTVMDDDPAWGHVPAADPAWSSAVAALLVDPDVARARETVGAAHGASYDQVRVWLTLTDTDEPAITLWVDDGGEDDGDDGGDDGHEDDVEVVVVGTYPAADLRGTDVAERTTAYVEIVGGLLHVVAEDD
ncbi:hypothetical protein [Nocardioides sp. CFH 31398]|uniref:hypothetical protein n=1 Tax=Nocardioides sp. CFH 31398 TaxID=2919579 RepID=UPI001F06A168|nr:hypothetical protein [Nocardioides sp. CFH 31398]MCH1868862.1 hypothetical protein [Nocardioides sp. CFH 31398]